MKHNVEVLLVVISVDLSRKTTAYLTKIDRSLITHPLDNTTSYECAARLLKDVADLTAGPLVHLIQGPIFDNPARIIDKQCDHEGGCLHGSVKSTDCDYCECDQPRYHERWIGIPYVLMIPEIIDVKPDYKWYTLEELKDAMPYDHFEVLLAVARRL